VLPLVGGAVALIAVSGVLGGVIVAVGAAALAYRRADVFDTARGRSAERLAQGGGWATTMWALSSIAWLIPAGLMFLAGAAWAVVYQPEVDRIPQLLGILAVGALWLSVILNGRSVRHRP